MSYDICLRIDTGGENPVRVSDWRSPTYNLYPMFCLAFGTTGINNLHEVKAVEAQKLLIDAINFMKNNKTKCEALNPKNGWGNYNVALEALEKLYQDCVDHPLAKVFV